MNSQWTKVAECVCKAARQMAERGLVVGASGNVSARIPETEMLAITPSGIPYEIMGIKDIIIINPGGKRVSGKHLPSSETPMHTRILRENPQVNAIVHTHSPYATAFSVLREAIPLVCNEGFGVEAVRVEVADYFIPGTEELGKAAMQALERQPGARAVLLANHGLLVLGDSLEQALNIAENVEWEARIYHLARSIGTPFQITRDQLDQVKRHYTALRSKSS